MPYIIYERATRVKYNVFYFCTKSPNLFILLCLDKHQKWSQKNAVFKVEFLLQILSDFYADYFIL